MSKWLSCKSVSTQCYAKAALHSVYTYVELVVVVVIAYCQLSCSVAELPCVWHVLVSSILLAQQSYVVVPLNVETYLYCAVPYGSGTVRYQIGSAFV